MSGREARFEALAKAMATRHHRSELLAKLKAGNLALEDFLARQDDVTGKTRIFELLTSLPGVGAVRGRRLLTELGISESRRVRGPGAQQRQRLVAAFAAPR
ncbi:integration host factor, actinobacterial type [Kitasatospora sp. MBT66]|uniref:integration host factor, actinobacterial type n=1 Tax=Kitasatospora sp. MBT66 TaxID=1444769 RepID=UPI0005BBA375|nr:integration host factor, actinobacterial type [Kitasatospora sp. MBT66]